MISNEIVDTEAGIDERDLGELEQRFGVSFPDSLKNHFLRFNGGRPIRNLFERRGEWFQIQEFLPINYGKRGCLFEDTFQDLVVDTPGFPKHLVPIAIDPGGDYYCVSLRSQDLGAVYCYMHDYFDDPDRAIEFMATTIEEFVNGMVADES